MTDWSEPLVDIRNNLDKLKHLLNQRDYATARLAAEQIAGWAERIADYCEEREER